MICCGQLFSLANECTDLLVEPHHTKQIATPWVVLPYRQITQTAWGLTSRRGPQLSRKCGAPMRLLVWRGTVSPLRGSTSTQPSNHKKNIIQINVLQCSKQQHPTVSNPWILHVTACMQGAPVAQRSSYHSVLY